MGILATANRDNVLARMLFGANVLFDIASFAPKVGPECDLRSGCGLSLRSCRDAAKDDHQDAHRG
jgi:hypothetical protein